MTRSKVIRIGLVTILLLFFNLTTPVYAADQTIKTTLKTTQNTNNNYISLDWETNDTNQRYRYQLYQIKDGETEAHSIQAKEEVKVLNIYPDYRNTTTIIPNTGLSEGQVDLEGKSVPDSGILKTWLLKENIDTVQIETVSLTDFNKNPSKYLKKTNGLWNYDSVFYGMWNLQPDFVYPNDTAIEYLRTYINDGGGFMTSHQTMGYRGLDRGVNKLANEMGVEIFSNSTATNYRGQYDDGTLFPTVSFVMLDNAPNDRSSFWPTGTQIEIVKKGALTDYPFQVGDLGEQYTIPYSHGLNIFAKGDVWMKTVNPTGFGNMAFQEITKSPTTGETGTNNFFVHTYNNTAIINSGHSFPDVSQAEVRIIANTLYYLSQITTATSWNDHSGQDLAAPESPNLQSVRYNKLSKQLSLNYLDVKDKSSTYKYYVKATSLKNGEEHQSNTVSQTITSGLKGYSIEVDEKATTIPDSNIETTENNYKLVTDLTTKSYIHIAAIDNQGNMTVTHYQVGSSNIADMTITQTPTAWTNQNVTLNVKTEGIKRIMLPNGTIITGDSVKYAVSENNGYSFIGIDAYDEIADIRTQVVSNIDKTGKKLKMTPDDDNWKNKDVQIEIKVVD